MYEQGLSELQGMEALFMASQGSGSGEMEMLFTILAGAGVVFNIIILVTFVLKAWGLWNINKKLGTAHPWLSWIPLVNIYMYYTAGNTSFMKYFVYPVIAYIVGLFLAVFTFGISAIAAVIYLLYCVIHMLHNISKRTGRGAWSTVGLIFIPFIMLPVIGHKLKSGPHPDVEAIKPKTPESISSSIDEEL